MLTQNKFTCYKDLANSDLIYSPFPKSAFHFWKLLYGISDIREMPPCTNGTLKVISYRNWHDSRVYYSNYENYLERQKNGFCKAKNNNEFKWQKELNLLKLCIKKPTFSFNGKDIEITKEKDIYNYFVSDVIPAAAKHNKRKKSEKKKGIKILVEFDKVAKKAKKDLRLYKKKLKQVEQDFNKKRNSENLQRSLRRTKQSIKKYVNCIEADHLITLTFRGVITDREYVKSCFVKFLRYLRMGFVVKNSDGAKIRKRNATKKIFDYIAVLERHKSGGYHVHIAVNGRKNIDKLRDAWYKSLGGNGDDAGEKTKGQINITHIKSRKKKNISNTISNYLSKYISKSIELDEMNGEETLFKRRFWRSYTCDKGANEPKIHYHCVYIDKDSKHITNNMIVYLKNALAVLNKHYEYKYLEHFHLKDYVANMKMKSFIKNDNSEYFLNREELDKKWAEFADEIPILYDYIDLSLY